MTVDTISPVSIYLSRF